MPFKDPKRGRAYQAAWYVKNREKVLNRTRAYNIVHREEKRVRDAARDRRAYFVAYRDTASGILSAAKHSIKSAAMRRGAS